MQKRIKVRRPSRSLQALVLLSIAFLGFVAGYATGLIIHYL